ncbi:unnamed protein product [Orchesella dallaii]|uniref:Uncharacterized protein n=1 Tax=Orchesella dallaii TaxID=48710 RepID=A0ABP1Q7F5_9HEXA
MAHFLLYSVFIALCLSTVVESTGNEHKLKISSHPNETDFDFNLRSDKTNTILTREKRATHRWMKRTSCDIVRQRWTSTHHANFRDPTHPITNVGYKEITKNRKTIRVVKHVHAELQSRLRNCPRRNFAGNVWDEQMRDLDARLTGSRGVKDEKGHIIASQICGPITWFNLAPQTPSVNRNVNPPGDAPNFRWINIEHTLAYWVNNQNGRVVIDVFLNYGRELDSLRPKGFKYCYKLYDGTGKVRGVGDSYFENEEPDNPSDDRDP